MNNLISVVVPIYKVEKYLDECINSIIHQTYTNLEIILVDDGSPDNCPKMCDEWAKKDERIKVIHKKNGGLSDARNAGLAIATGEYISFIDSDDFLELDLYKLAIENLNSENAQIFAFGRYYVYGDQREVHQKQNVKLIMNSEEALDTMNKFGYYDVAAWDKVYKRSLFDEIIYPVGKISEDWFVTYKLIDRADKIIYDSKPLYNYRQRANSITHSSNVKINYDVIDASSEVLDFINKKYPNIVLNANTRYIYTLIGVYNNILCYDKVNRKDKLSSLYRKIKKDYKKIIRNKDLTFGRRNQLFLIVRFNFLYNFVIRQIKKLKDNKSK